jgi:hypothetical protein
MCLNNECPMAKECYRHEAIPTPFRQSFSKFEPAKRDDGSFWCSWFAPLSEWIPVTTP